MQLIIFLVEIILIFFWLEIDKLPSNQTQEEQSQYSSYYSIDIVGDHILTLKNITQNEKLTIWKASALKDEMLSHFPNFNRMLDFFNNRVNDDGAFKKKFLEYMKDLHSEYITGNISKEEFKQGIINPPNSLVIFY